MYEEGRKTAVSVGVRDDGSPAAALASRLQLPLIPVREGRPAVSGVEFLLYRDGEGLLCLRECVSGVSISAGFEGGQVGYRRRQSPGAELLVKAVGGGRAVGQTVLDATAGLGRDAMLLASAGFVVTLVERSPVITALLSDALARASASDDESLRRVTTRMELHEGDARQWMQDGRVDVVYLDPMFPPRRKSARVRKEMALLGKLLGSDDSGDELLEPALRTAGRRVVVKRPRLASHLAGRRPDWQIRGRSSRFDVYSARS